MPKVGMEPIRRKALISATIETIGDERTLDVRVSDIAQRAGVSSALAHHYFGGKDQLFDATMRHLLVQLGRASAASQKQTETPRARLVAILETNFSSKQFARSTIAAWLIFYVRAMKSSESARLLRIYTKRLRSNLVHALGQMVPRDEALRISEGAAALIDGLWLRAALGTTSLDAHASIEMVENHIEAELAGHRK